MVAPQDSDDNLGFKRAKFEGNMVIPKPSTTPLQDAAPPNAPVVKSFMAHHQGMSFLSLSYLLLDRPMQARFESNVEVKSTLLLLQEKIPRITNF